LNGFRNRDLRPLLFGTAEASSSEIRRQASAVTRKLSLLRAHGLIRKVPKTHRYMLTPRGQLAIAALSAARQANTAELAQIAA
jgi:DNA-binding IclR family transcriptional regulator